MLMQVYASHSHCVLYVFFLMSRIDLKLEVVMGRCRFMLTILRMEMPLAIQYLPLMTSMQAMKVAWESEPTLQMASSQTGQEAIMRGSTA